MPSTASKVVLTDPQAAELSADSGLAACWRSLWSHRFGEFLLESLNHQVGGAERRLRACLVLPQ
jgi:hypothetical protein